VESGEKQCFPRSEPFPACGGRGGGVVDDALGLWATEFVPTAVHRSERRRPRIRGLGPHASTTLSTGVNRGWGGDPRVVHGPPPQGWGRTGRDRQNSGTGLWARVWRNVRGPAHAPGRSVDGPARGAPG